MNRETKDLLWMWIIGLSDIIIHCKSGQLDYTDEVLRCNDEVLRLHPNRGDDGYDEEGYVQAQRGASYKDIDLF